MFDEAISEFWEWWSGGGADGLLAAIESGEDTDLPATVTGLVHAIHPMLEWQLTAGHEAAHSFALSASGERRLRGVTERWLQSAPETDGTWEFHAARIAVALAPFDADGVTIDPGAVTLTTEWDPTYEQVDITAHLPGTEDFEESAISELVLYLLDATLGEDDTERWVGIIDPVPERPMGAIGLASLPEIIEDTTRQATNDGWIAAEQRLSKRETVIATVNVSLKYLDHLAHSFHLEVRIHLNESTPLGMPTEEEASVIVAIEDEVFELLGDDVVFVARETGVNQLVMHFYGTDPDRLEQAIAPWSDEHPTHRIDFDILIDPEWSTISQLT